MDDSMFLPIGIGLIVLVVVGGVGLVMSGSFAKMAEERLEGLTGGAASGPRKPSQAASCSARRRSTWAEGRSGPSSSPTPRTSTCSTSRPTST